MRENNKKFNIFYWIITIIVLLVNYIIVLPLCSGGIALGIAATGDKELIIIPYLILLIVSEVISLIPTLLFLKIDKKTFKRNYKYISILNTLLSLYFFSIIVSFCY